MLDFKKFRCVLDFAEIRQVEKFNKWPVWTLKTVLELLMLAIIIFK